MIQNLRARNSALYHSLVQLRDCINLGDVYVPKDIPQIFFICGANRTDLNGKSHPSYRREEFISFLQRQFSNVHPFLAEQVFNKLIQKEKKKNILKLEQELFDLSDNVAIILESNSTFCELGAFSHNPALLKKLLIINDATYEKAESFINMGPLELIQNENRVKSVFWYKMGDVSSSADSISDIYEEVENLINDRNRQKSSKAQISVKQLSKNELLFARDLIAMCGSVKGKEFFEILKVIFGNDDYGQIHTVLALLEAMKLISFEKGIYTSTSQNLFFEYRKVNIVRFKAAFRVFSLRHKRL